jgi:hypothetical protein
VAIIILLLIAVSMLVVPATASNVAITVENQQVKAEYILSLQQNVTKIPDLTTSVSMASDEKLSSAFANALKVNNQTATPSNLTVNVESKGGWLNLTTSMTVTGVTVRRGDVLAVDMAWKAFNVSTNLQAGNLSYNTVGKTYLLPVTSFYANASRSLGHPNATFTGISFFVNSTAVSSQTAENYVGNFTVFDFRALQPSIDGWPRTYSVTNDTTAWRFARTSLLDFSIAAQHANQTTRLFAKYGYDAEVSVSGLARTQGNTVLVDVGTGRRELAMAGIVAITVIVAIAAQFMYRAKKKKFVRARW